MKRVRVRPHSGKDARIAKELERYLNTPEALAFVRTRVYQQVLNELLYGEDRTRWPN